MPNINKNIIKQAGAAVANATNKAAGLSASTPEPGTIISAIQLVNGGRVIGPTALAHFTESVRNKLLSLLVTMVPIQSGSGDPSPDNVRPISGRTGLTIYVSPTPTAADATTYSVDWTSEAGTVYGGTLDVVTGLLTVYLASVDMGTLSWSRNSTYNVMYTYLAGKANGRGNFICSNYKTVELYYEYLSSGEISGALNNNAINAKDDAYTSAAAFKTAMNGVQLVYELATPITYQLTGTDIVTLVGDNYIWSDSGDVIITE